RCSPTGSSRRRGNDQAPHHRSARRQARPHPRPRAATRRGAGGASSGRPPPVQALAPGGGAPARDAAAGGAAEGDVAPPLPALVAPVLRHALGVGLRTATLAAVRASYNAAPSLQVWTSVPAIQRQTRICDRP